MGRGPNKSKEERTIITGCMLAGFSRVQCNKMLAQKGYPAVKYGYWDMTPMYLEAMMDASHPYTLYDHVNGAPSLSKLKEMNQ